MHAMLAHRAEQGLVNPPCPRLPTTSSSAPSDASSSTRAGLPSATVDLAQAQLPRPGSRLPRRSGTAGMRPSVGCDQIMDRRDVS